MEKRLGGILKINRNQCGLSLSYIAERTGITESQLSRFERNKENVSFDKMQEIVNVLNLKINPEDISEEFEKLFFDFYKAIVYDRDYETPYQKIKDHKDTIQISSSYVKYLLVEMIYNNLQGEYFNLNHYLYLEKYHMYLEPYQIQIFYDYLGSFCYYNNKDCDKAITYFDMAEQVKGNTLSKSMLFYHRAIISNRKGNSNLAMNYAQEANTLFSKTLNLKRLTLNTYLTVMISTNMNNCTIAEEQYLNCLSAFQDLGMEKEIKDTYNNLLWDYVLSKKYNKIINIKDEAITNSDHDCDIYFYISYAYYKYNDLPKAKQYATLAENDKISTSSHMQSLIHAFYVYLHSSSMKKNERLFLQAYKESMKNQRKQNAIFILRFLIELYKNENDIVKQNIYLEKVLELQ